MSHPWKLLFPQQEKKNEARKQKEYDIVIYKKCWYKNIQIRRKFLSLLAYLSQTDYRPERKMLVDVENAAENDSFFYTSGI